MFRRGQMLSVRGEKVSESLFLRALKRTLTQWPGSRLIDYSCVESGILGNVWVSSNSLSFKGMFLVHYNSTSNWDTRDYFLRGNFIFRESDHSHRKDFCGTYAGFSVVFLWTCTGWVFLTILLFFLLSFLCFKTCLEAPLFCSGVQSLIEVCNSYMNARYTPKKELKF